MFETLGRGQRRLSMDLFGAQNIISWRRPVVLFTIILSLSNFHIGPVSDLPDWKDYVIVSLL
jgi:hypothetical protein